MAIMKMLTLVAPWPRSGPRLDDEIVSLIEHLTIVSGIGVVKELFAAGAPDPPSDEPPP